MNHVERITLIVQLDLKLQCLGQAIVRVGVYILVKGTITVANTAAADADARFFTRNCKNILILFFSLI